VGGRGLIVLDTHVLLWWQADGGRLSASAARAIEQADRLGLCPISFWEVALLVRKGRIALDRDPHRWATDVLRDERIQLVPLSATAAITAGLLPADGFEGDPADCLIYATAREHSVALVTKDRRIHEFAAAAKGQPVIW
jgi:PIN domain nuclease of toxin-antitoxin system